MNRESACDRAVGDPHLLSPGAGQESLDDARLLAEAERWNAGVNRLYYSCFYAVSALLVRDGLSSSRHTGVRSLLNRHYVRTGKVPRDLARVYNDLFERRQEGDYADFVRFQADQVRPWIPQTEAFIAHMKALLSKDAPQVEQPS